LTVVSGSSPVMEYPHFGIGLFFLQPCKQTAEAIHICLLRMKRREEENRQFVYVCANRARAPSIGLQI